MTCKKCGKDTDDIYCPYCGTKLRRVKGMTPERIFAVYVLAGVAAVAIFFGGWALFNYIYL